MSANAARNLTIFVTNCQSCGQRNGFAERPPMNCVRCGESLRAMKSRAGMTLFSPMQIAAAAFIGGWLAGIIVLALSYFRWKRVRAVIVLVILGAMLLAVRVELAASMPLVSRIPDVVRRMFVMLVTLLIATLAQRGQLNARGDRRTAARRLCAWLVPVVVALISMAAIQQLVLV